MARAKLLRQYIEDYQRKVAGVNEQVEAANAQYQSAYQGYADRANAYNAWVDQVKAGGDRDYFKMEDGTWRYMTGRDGQLQAIAPGGRTAPPTYNAIYDSADQLKASRATGYNLVRNPDGTVTPYQTISGRGGLTYNPMNNTYGATGRLGEFNEQAPAAPVAPEPVRAPNLTRSNMKEMANPGLSQGQLALTRAQGFEGKSELRGDEMAAPTSAFANQDDPNNLKEKGILARVMGGEL